MRKVLLQRTLRNSIKVTLVYVAELKFELRQPGYMVQLNAMLPFSWPIKTCLVDISDARHYEGCQETKDTILNLKKTTIL